MSDTGTADDPTLPLNGDEPAGEVSEPRTDEAPKSRRPRTRRQDRPPKPNGAPAPGRTPSGRKSRAKPKQPSVGEMIQTYYLLIGQMWQVKDPICGAVFLENVPSMVAAWESWANQSPGIERALRVMSGPSGPLGVAMAHLPLLMAVQAHHAVPVEQRIQFELAHGQEAMAQATYQRHMQRQEQQAGGAGAGAAAA